MAYGAITKEGECSHGIPYGKEKDLYPKSRNV